MNLKMFFAMLTLGVSAWMLQSCDDDDDLSVVPVELTASLSEKYPQATRVAVSYTHLTAGLPPESPGL